VTGYEIGEPIDGLSLKEDCSAPPCNALIFDTEAISATNIETELKILLDGGNSAKSSKIQIEVIHDKKKIMPSFS
jgi:hypothetical protein